MWLYRNVAGARRHVGLYLVTLEAGPPHWLVYVQKLPCNSVRGASESRTERQAAGQKLRQHARGAAEGSLKGFVMNQARPLGTVSQHELAGVKCFELGPVADADDGRVRQTLQHQLHKLLLGQRIEGGG